MNITRVFGLFAAVFAIAYAIAFEFHFELFSYHPRLGEFGWGRQPVKQSPVMHWYGSMGTGLVAALVASAVALPFVQKKQPPLWLGWLVPLVSPPCLKFPTRRSSGRARPRGRSSVHERQPNSSGEQLN